MNSALWIMVACPCVINLSLWWDFTFFPTTVTDPSHSLRMTFNVSLIMKPYRISSFRAEVRMLYENEEKSQHNTERRIYYSDDTLRFPLITAADPSHSFRMTFYGLLHHDSEPSSSLRVIPDRPPSERAVAHAARLRILNRHDDSNRKRTISL